MRSCTSVYTVLLSLVTGYFLNTQQVHNKHTTSTQQVHNKYTTRTQQVHNKYKQVYNKYTTSTQQEQLTRVQSCMFNLKEWYIWFTTQLTFCSTNPEFSTWKLIFFSIPVFCINGLRIYTRQRNFRKLSEFSTFYNRK